MVVFAGLLKDLLVVLHFIGLAALFGGFILQIKALRNKAAEILPAMVHGAWTMFITGLLLVGAREWEIILGAGRELDNTKIAVKTLVALFVLILVVINRKKKPTSSAALGAIGGLTLLNIVLAVFW
jgi:TRAP-type mannitol/chloroaromatic compound transport system permease large subunit